MTKEEFFDQLHAELASKTGLPDKQIATIRQFILGDGKTRKELAGWAASKTHQSNLKRSHSKKYYQQFLNFVASSPEALWNEVTQKTEYDTGGKK